jgi:hypothetical protein
MTYRRLPFTPVGAFARPEPATFGGTAFLAAALAGLSFVVSHPAARGRAAGMGHIARGVITPDGRCPATFPRRH